LTAAYRNQRERIEQLEAFINRFRAQATKAKQVQSRIKELDKIERIEIPPEEQTIHFKFRSRSRAGALWRSSRCLEELRAEVRIWRRQLRDRARRPGVASGVNGAGSPQ
jgi:ATP-binding cassette subfamily F protein 3